jgi:thiol-disulfide isomerase/thioredoxin
MRRLRARSVLLAGILAIGLGCGSDEVPSVADSTPRAGGTAPYLVKIHADWCGVCNRLTPIWSRLGEEYGDSVQMVFFDVTDREAVDDSAREAARLGLDSFFDSHKGQTGTIAVLDGTTRESLAVFRGEMVLDKYQAVLDELRDEGGA